MPKFLSILAAAGLTLTAIHPALAHATLKRAMPAIGSSSATAPQEVRLEFSEGIEARLSSVSVSSETAGAVALGPVETDPAHREVLTAKITGHLHPGSYKVVWKVVSVDSHKTEGSFTFTIAP